MEYLLINRSSLQALCSSIGWQNENGQYEINANCLATLTSIENQLLNENLTTRNIRLSLGLSRIIEKDLLHILEQTDTIADPIIIQTTVRLLVNLTLPAEVLLPSYHQPSSPFNDLGCSNHSLATRIKQLQKILLDAKKGFISSNQVTASLINTMKLASLTSSPNFKATNQNLPFFHSGKSVSSSFIQQNLSGKIDSNENKLDNAERNLIRDCLLLFRNLLHVPDKTVPHVLEPDSGSKSEERNVNKEGNGDGRVTSGAFSKDDWQDAQRRIIWNLMVQGLDNTLLFLMSTPHRRNWICQIVQLITLLYKNQPVSKLIQCISTKNSASDCSEDDVESDHTLSAQRSSSTSILSDSSSSKECGAQSSESKNDSGYYQQTELESTCSITECIKTNGSNIAKANRDDNMDTTNGSNIEWEKNIKMKESGSDDISMENGEIFAAAANDKDSEENETSHSLSNEEEKNDAKSDIQETERMEEDSICNQTSGFSGSSEEDDRRMHKVKKSHQRSTAKPSESDDSDDSDYAAIKAVRSHHHPPNVTRKTKNCSTIPRSPHCCPSICMETAIAAALSSISVSSEPMTKTKQSNSSNQPTNIAKSSLLTSKASTNKSKDRSNFLSNKKTKTTTSPHRNVNSSPTNPNPTETEASIKPIAPWDKKKTCGSKSSSIGNESIAPSDSDICSLLKEFTLKFVHNFFSCLILDLSKELLLTYSSTSNSSSPPPKFSSSLDISHLLWLLSYFLKISSSIDLNYNHISPILQIDMFAFLVYNGLIINEELELLSTRTMGGSSSALSSSTESPSTSRAHLSPSLPDLILNSSSPKETGVNFMHGDLLQDESIKKLTRKLQLLIAALKEMILTVSGYISKASAGEEEKQSLRNLRSSLANMTGLRQFFLLLTRCYSPVIHPRSFLVDSIITHHHLMLLLDDPNQRANLNLVEHLQQFATIKVMEQYGRVLESFQSNSEMVNNCVFTVMHHVAGDLRNPECLFQPIILKTFSLIMESDMELLDSWEDLMEYVMNRFVKAATKSNANKSNKMIGVSSEVGRSTDNNSIVDQIPINSSVSLASGIIGSTESSDNQIICEDENIIEKVRGGSTTTSTHQTRDATICSSVKSCGSDESSSIDLTNLDTNHDQLYWLYLQYEQTNDPITCILEVIMEEQGISLDRTELISQLMIRRIISSEEYDRFMEYSYGLETNKNQVDGVNCDDNEDINDQIEDIEKDYHNQDHKDSTSYQKMESSSSDLNACGLIKTELNLNHEETIIINVDQDSNMLDETAREVAEIDRLIEKLIKMGFGDQLSWISSILLDIVNVKMCQVKGVKQDCQILEPVAYFSNLLGQPVPIVPFNEKQELALNSKPMVELLNRIGFHLPNDVSKLYPRIPIIFTPDIIFKIACKISSPETKKLLFKPEEILETGNL